MIASGSESGSRSSGRVLFLVDINQNEWSPRVDKEWTDEKGSSEWPRGKMSVGDGKAIRQEDGRTGRRKGRKAGRQEGRKASSPSAVLVREKKSVRVESLT